MLVGCTLAQSHTWAYLQQCKQHSHKEATLDFNPPAWCCCCCSCRSHIESLIAAAAAQQVQSELAVRVSGWRSRIDPILAAEEDRSAFDIHTYGSKILERLQDTQPAAAEAEAAAEKAAEQQRQQNDAAGCEAEIVDFKQVAGASDSFEVCRLFAAMLQLVNNR